MTEEGSVFAGMGRSLIGLLGRGAKPKSIAEQIEEAAEAQVQKILSGSSEDITYTREDNTGFCDFIEDRNRIHRDSEAARAYKFVEFKDTPIVGALLASTGARISRNAVSQLRTLWEEDENDLKVIGQEVAFRDPAYPDEEISWRFEGYKEKTDEVNVTLTANAKKRKIMELTTRLGREYRRPVPEIAGPILSKANFVDGVAFAAAARFTHGEYAPGMIPILVASFAPAGLLRILDTMSGDKEAANLRMNIEYLRDPHPGRFQTDMFFPAKMRPSVARPLYKFRTVASQNTQPINYMEIRCATSQPLDFNRIQSALMPAEAQEDFSI